MSGGARWCAAALAGAAVVGIGAVIANAQQPGRWTEIGCYIVLPDLWCGPVVEESDPCPPVPVMQTGCMQTASTSTPEEMGRNARMHHDVFCEWQFFTYDPVLGCVDAGAWWDFRHCTDITGDICGGTPGGQ